MARSPVVSPFPIREVESVYADCGHPGVMTGFVTFMPSGPPISNAEAGETRMYSEWRRFLLEEVEWFNDEA